VSWGWEPQEAFLEPFQHMFEWMGTYNPAAYLTVPAAIDWQAERDWPAVRVACHELLLEASHRIAALSGLPQMSPDTSDWWIQMRTIPLLPCNLTLLKERLWNEYQIEVPMVGWNGGHYVRVSIQCYNGPNEVDRLLEALERLLPETAL
jgi:isopenicillin-N epimerase